MFRKVFFFGFVLFACIFSTSHAAENDTVDCSSEDIVKSIFNEPIPLTLNGTILIYENVTISRLISTANNEFDKNYIDARLQRNATTGSSSSLVIFATENFARYAQEQTAVRITLKIVLDCGEGRERTLIFFQPIKEGNYFRPTFSQDVYEVIIPTPLFAGFDLTFFTEISARDEDLIDNQIEFTSPDAARYHIIVSTKNATSDPEGKVYLASLKLQRIYLALPMELTIEIMAKDYGTPSLNSTAIIKVRADPNNNLPPAPVFESSIYNTILNTDLTLKPLNLSIVNVVDATQLTFRKKGADQHLFILETTALGVAVRLAQALTLADLRDKEYLQLIVMVEYRQLIEQRETVVMVMLPHLQELFHFAKQLYEGSIDNAGNVHMEDVVFEHFFNSSEVVFKLSGMSAEYFDLERTNSSLKLKPTVGFKLENWLAYSYFTISVEAALADFRAISTLFIELPKNEVNMTFYPPEFERPLYDGTINENWELALPTIALTASANRANRTFFSLSGDYSELFELHTVVNNVQLLLLSTNMTLLQIKSPILLVLTAQLDNLTAYASIVIEVYGRSVSTAERLFDKPWHVGHIEVEAETGKQTLQLTKIKLKVNYKVTDYDYSLQGELLSFFDINVDAAANTVNVGMLQSLPNNTFFGKCQIYLELRAVYTANVSVSDTVPIFIELPKKECTEPFPPASLPVFDSSEYIFAAKPNQMGSLGQIAATVPGTNATLQYSLTVESDHLRARLSINPTNGELLLLSYVSPGIYRFRINAECIGNSERTSVAARLDVDSLLQCDDQHVAVANALIVKYIDEERPHLSVLNASMGDCRYRLTHMYPNDKSYVYINETTNMLATIAIDREDAIFANMSVPQIQVRLKLYCASDRVSDNMTDLAPSERAVGAATSDQALLLAEDIPYAKDLTLLYLILLDVNDNAPVFVQPTEATHLGYPNSEISFELFPQYLTQVRAVDRDEGLNAQLLYGITSNSHFDIDAASGIIYPKANALELEDATELLVTATDRAGSNNGLRTNLMLFVKRLAAEHYSLLTVSNVASGSFEKHLQALRAQTGYSIVVAKQATLPLNVFFNRTIGSLNKRAMRAAESALVQQAWIYAFDGEEAVLCEDLQDKVATASNVSQFLSMATYAEVGLTANHELVPKHETDVPQENVSYIVATVILSLISAACICFLIWQYYLRNCSSCNENKPVSNGCPTVSGYKKQPTEQFTKDTYLPRSASSDSVCRTTQDLKDKGESPRAAAKAEHRRSQVTFNELVERIQIDVNEANHCD